MHEARFLIVVVVASLAASLTDWLFMGVLFHDRYQSAPEIWRASTGANEPRLILYSQVIGVISCGALTCLCAWFHLSSAPQGLTAALLVWLAGPAVVLAQMVLWIKMHPLVGLSHAFGWLARFAITALLAVWLLK